MALKIKVGGAWKDTSPQIKVGGAWKEVSKGFVKVGGIWKEFFSAAAPLFGLATAVYDGVSFSVASEQSGSNSVIFSPDGLNMYIAGTSQDFVHQYDLTTAFDITTASYNNKRLLVQSEDLVSCSIAFNSDGTKLFVLGRGNDAVYQYGLTTPYDISTGSYDSVSLSIVSQENVPSSMRFSPDGTKLFISGYQNDGIKSWTLSTPFNITTASYDGVLFSTASQDAAPGGIAFSPDGTKMYVAGLVTDTIYQYSLATAFSLVGASYDNISFSPAAQESGPSGLEFNNDNSLMFVVGFSNNTVYQYSFT